MPKRAAHRLDFCNFKLDTLLEITKSINNNLSTEELLEKFKNILTKRLVIGNVLVLAYNNGWESIFESSSEGKKFPDIDVERDLLSESEITTVTAAGLDHLRSFDTIIPVYHNNKPVAFVLIGDVDEEREGVSPTIKHLHFIQTLTNVIIVAIENRRLVQESLRQEAIKKELELASRMQSMLIPDSRSFPRDETIWVEAFYLPHFDVGGDYYDFFRLNDEEYAFCMSDVSGKGISAAILMSNFQANLKALFTPGVSLTELVARLNERVMKSANGEKFITAFIGKYNDKTRELHYVNAGHNPPFIYDKVTNSVDYLTEGCPGLGMLDEIPFIRKGSVRIENNSKLLCYTDGLVELKGEDTTDAGMKAVEACIADSRRIDDTISFIVESLDINKDNAAFFDDVSMLGIEFI